MTAVESPFPRIAARHAADVAPLCKLTPPSAALLSPEQTPLDFLDRLLANEKLRDDALMFLCQALSKQDAVWWGCLCVCLAYDNHLDPAVHEALHTAANWVLKPEETQRRACESAAKKIGLATPAGGVAQAAFQSGGSISAPNLPKAEPPPELCGRTLRGALHLAATLPPAKSIPIRYRQFVALGLAIAQGKITYESVVRSP